MDDDSAGPEQKQMMADALDLTQFDATTVENGVMTRVHSPEACVLRSIGCWIHRPTPDWPLAGRPVYYEARTAVAYRQCEHGVLHPDIDAVRYLERGITRYQGRGVRPGDPSYHPQCDGC